MKRRKKFFGGTGGCIGLWSLEHEPVNFELGVSRMVWVFGTAKTSGWNSAGCWSSAHFGRKNVGKSSTKFFQKKRKTRTTRKVVTCCLTYGSTMLRDFINFSHLKQNQKSISKFQELKELHK